MKPLLRHYLGITFVVLFSAPLAISWGQIQPLPPIVSPRGVTDATARWPAPGALGQGAVVRIAGQRLGPEVPVVTKDPVWPTSLAGTQVWIDDQAAALYSVSSDLVVAQVPVSVSPGAVWLVVRRDSNESSPIRILVAQAAPSVRSKDNTGHGELETAASGAELQFAAGGLGASNPPVGGGAAGPADTPAIPLASLSAFVGGFRAPALAAAASAQRVGEFDVKVTVPAGAQAGDPVHLLASDQSTYSGNGSNAATYQHLDKLQFTMIPFPAGTPEITSVTTPDWNGDLVLASGAAEPVHACHKSVLADATKPGAKLLDLCLTLLPGMTSPGIIAPNGVGLLATVGPPLGGYALALLKSGEDPRLLEMPAPLATQISGRSNGNYSVGLDGKIAHIDVSTGEVTATAEPTTKNVPASVDGMVGVSLFSAFAPDRTIRIYADDRTNPLAAEFVIFDRDWTVVFTASFPAGWVPLLVPPSTPGGTAPQAAMLYRSAEEVHFTLARVAGSTQQGVVTFRPEDGAISVVPFPDGVFAASCQQSIRLFAPLSKPGVMLFGGHAGDIGVKNPCRAEGFIVVDSQSQSAFFLIAGGPFNTSSSYSGMMNDYIYAANNEPSRSNHADTLFVLDCANLKTMQFTVPKGTFTSLSTTAEMNHLTAVLGTATGSGDAGVAMFDLEAGTSRVIPLPDGAYNMASAAIYPATRKLVAIVAKAGLKVAVYDLIKGGWTVYISPVGVGFLGNYAYPVHYAVHANRLAAVAYDPYLKQMGIVVARIP